MIVKGFVVPGKPHPLVAADKNPGWGKLRTAFDQVRDEIQKIQPDLILVYSTQWVSKLGHQIQADPEPEWTLVDQEWHEFGEIPYKFKIDSEFAEKYRQAGEDRGLHIRTVAYRGFPIDPGTVTALKLLNPNNEIPACAVSCNMYADRGETLVLGKAARDACDGKKAVAVAVTSLSHRFFTEGIDPKEDRIYSPKDEEWNQKLLQFFAEGKLEDVSQLAREFSKQAHADMKLKAVWWLAAVMGQHNRYEGKVYEYQPIWGTGAALVGLTPSEKSDIQKEFDEADIEYFDDGQSILSGAGPQKKIDAQKSDRIVRTDAAPKPVGAYPHARREGEFLFLSGIGPRKPGNDEIPGGPIRDTNGKPKNYDVAAQTRSVIENVKTILKEAGSSLEKVLDVTVYLVDMDRDFKSFNQVYTEYFEKIQATRTTVAVRALPTPIAVEFKVVARV